MDHPFRPMPQPVQEKRSFPKVLVLVALVWLVSQLYFSRWYFASPQSARLVRLRDRSGQLVRIEVNMIRPLVAREQLWVDLSLNDGQTAIAHIDPRRAEGEVLWNGEELRYSTHALALPGGSLATAHRENQYIPHAIRVLEANGHTRSIAFCARVAGLGFRENALEGVCSLPNEIPLEGQLRHFLVRDGTPLVRPIPCFQPYGNANEACGAPFDASLDEQGWNFVFLRFDYENDDRTTMSVFEAREGQTPALRNTQSLTANELPTLAPETIARGPYRHSERAQWIALTRSGRWSAVNVPVPPPPYGTAALWEQNGRRLASVDFRGNERVTPNGNTFSLVTTPQGEARIERNTESSLVWTGPNARVSEWIPLPSGGGWLLGSTDHAYWIATVDASLRRTDVPGVLQRVLDATDRLLLDNESVPRDVLATCRVATVWMTLGGLIAFLATLGLHTRWFSPRRKRWMGTAPAWLWLVSALVFGRSFWWVYAQ